MNYDQCPVMRTLEIIGGKWKPIILHYLHQTPRRTGELARLIPQASGKMLTQQLRELERDGVILRTVHHQVPPKVEYSLAQLGDSLRPVIVAMCTWALKHPSEESRAFGAQQTEAASPIPSPRRTRVRAQGKHCTTKRRGTSLDGSPLPPA